MAAVLTCGDGAVLSHRSAGELWGILRERPGPVTLSVPAVRRPRGGRGIEVHRRRGDMETAWREGVPVTTPTDTLIDLAATLAPRRLEAAVNEADRLDLIDPETLRNSLDDVVRRPGTAALRKSLDQHTYTRTDSDLERRFLRLAREAGLPRPETQKEVNGFRVDFLWPQLGLVVETDGLRYHRTPAQQANDRHRDQVHMAAGLKVLRFTHAQVTRDGDRVRQVLSLVAS
ncbi:MAG TPA: DUF559 domain-containing protein [Solirubrobacteraceae bacterium]|nr:DUF559 domain-containing protein [Solirubrobacteraceae bacterium]